MKLIKPKLISGEIMSLFDDAENMVIVICPYYKMSRWLKLLKCLNDLRSRKIYTEFYVRTDAWESIEDLHHQGIEPFTIPNFHTKLYLNEKQAIISSMNLLLSSDNNSLDIAMKTETAEEYNELYTYYKKYIQKYSAANNEGATSNYTPSSENNTLKFADGHKVSEQNNILTQAKAFCKAQLNLLEIEMSNKFPSIRINLGSTYLYITNIIPFIALFVSLNEIVIKYTIKNPASINLENLSKVIRHVFKNYTIEHKMPTENYNYHTWTIKVNDNTEEYVKVIELIKTIV